ncbi:hypothetical protein ACGFIY_32720 [Micromonospora chersina]|uniref:hypothetical protein n=1 Tax=Micromonospora chersina TaxID=47854 RepID=UPI0037109917
MTVAATAYSLMAAEPAAIFPLAVQAPDHWLIASDAEQPLPVGGVEGDPLTEEPSANAHRSDRMDIPITSA